MNRGIYEYYCVSDETYLKHHGIQKQKWGVRHGPPYPLDYEDHSKAEKKALHKVNKKPEAKTQTKQASKIDDVKDRAKRKLDEALVKIGMKKAEELVNTKGLLDDFINDQRTQYNISEGKNFFDGMVDQQVGWVGNNGQVQYTSYSDNDIVKTRRVKEGDDHFGYISDSDVKRINPDYNSILNKAGSRNNCVSCTLTAELMRQGYQGVRAGKSMLGHNDYDVEKYFPGAKVEGISNVGSDIDSWVMNKYGAGSSGYFAGAYTKEGPTGSKSRVGGHAIHWAFDESGGMHVTDGQNGKTYNSLYDACNDIGFDLNFKSNISRLDNVRPDVEQMNSDGIIQASWSRIDGQDTSPVYKSKARESSRDNYYQSYADARKEAKRDTYEAYKAYKKQFYY